MSSFSLSRIGTNDGLCQEEGLAFESLARQCMEGCEESRNELAKYLHDDFYEIACRLCRGHNFARSLHATHLLNETYLRLLKSGVFREPKSRKYVFGAACQTMRNVIADYFRRNNAKKRSVEGQRVYLDHLLDQVESQDYSFSELDAALSILEANAPRQAEVVHLRFFLGMSMPEIASQLQISLSTAESDWRKARAWLYRELT